MNVSPLLLDKAKRLSWAARKRRWESVVVEGAGYYSVVLGVDDDWVLKVSGCGDWHEGTGKRARIDETDAWPDWARFCQDIDSPYIPRIRLVESGVPGVTTALIERLHEDRERARYWIDNMPPDVCNLLGGFGERHPEHSLDLHSGNVMFRECGQAVMTDPFRGPYE